MYTYNRKLNFCFKKMFIAYSFIITQMWILRYIQRNRNSFLSIVNSQIQITDQFLKKIMLLSDSGGLNDGKRSRK